MREWAGGAERNSCASTQWPDSPHPLRFFPKLKNVGGVPVSCRWSAAHLSTQRETTDPTTRTHPKTGHPCRGRKTKDYSVTKMLPPHGAIGLADTHISRDGFR